MKRPPNCKLPDFQANALAFASLIAHRLILFNWKSSKAPSFLQWLKEVLSFWPLEKIWFKICKNNKNFVLTWSPFMNFVQGFPFQWRLCSPGYNYRSMCTLLYYQQKSILLPFFSWARCVCVFITIFALYCVFMSCVRLDKNMKPKYRNFIVCIEPWMAHRMVQYYLENFGIPNLLIIV